MKEMMIYNEIAKWVSRYERNRISDRMGTFSTTFKDNVYINYATLGGST